MSKHGNSRQSDEVHHLYHVFDKKEKKVYKYGISDNPIESDGLSKRLRYQLNLFNRVVGLLRFTGKILLNNIPGRKRALEIEEEYIEKFRKKNGKRPRRNP